MSFSVLKLTKGFPKQQQYQRLQYSLELSQGFSQTAKVLEFQNFSSFHHLIYSGEYPLEHQSIQSETIIFFQVLAFYSKLTNLI